MYLQSKRTFSFHHIKLSVLPIQFQLIQAIGAQALATQGESTVQVFQLIEKRYIVTALLPSK